MNVGVSIEPCAVRSFPPRADELASRWTIVNGVARGAAGVSIRSVDDGCIRRRIWSRVVPGWMDDQRISIASP
jgi:hypothetical protein